LNHHPGSVRAARAFLEGCVKRKLSERILNSFWLYTGVPYVIFLGFVLVPFLMGGFYSLTDWNGVSRNLDFVGFSNFVKMFREDPGFMTSAWFTIRLTVASVVIVNLIGLIYAVLFHNTNRWNSVLRVVLVLPNVIGGIILGFVWQFIFSQALPSLGGVLETIPWLGDGSTAFWAVLIVLVWQQSGYVMLIYIASMNSIDQQLFEAAEIDGASRAAQFFRITLPLIVPAFTVSIFIVLAYSFKIFGLVFALTGGGPYGSTESLAINIYNEAFLYGNYGLGSAKAVVFFVAVAVMSYLQVRFTQKREVSL
jgi:raffinose/stachyose/melibiose transport system permease protein